MNKLKILGIISFIVGGAGLIIDKLIDEAADKDLDNRIDEAVQKALEDKADK